MCTTGKYNLEGGLSGDEASARGAGVHDVRVALIDRVLAKAARGWSGNTAGPAGGADSEELKLE